MSEQIAIYLYKTINAGKFTKYIVSVTGNGDVVVEHYFKNRRKSQLIFTDQKDIKWADLPKNIKQVALWAKYESKAFKKM